jgi:serine/threonine protein kinase
MEAYTTERELGHGAFGVAFLTTRKDDGRRCVIKRIRMREMSKRDAGAARREVSVMQEVKHPNIIGYYDSFVEMESMHIVMEYADGGTLHDVVRRARQTGALAEASILQYFAQILAAVRCLHQHRILHRDLKTANVFLTAAGAVKLGDFGLSRMLSSHSQFAKSTVGTAYQLSPELCKGKPYGTESDVWALGCILYELCARRHAFAGPSLPATVMKIMRGAYDRIVPGSAPPAYSEGLVEVMERCLTISTADRWLLDDMMEHPLLVERVAALDAQAALESAAKAAARGSPAQADPGQPTPITSVERGGGWMVGTSREGGWGNAADTLRRSIPENSITPTGLGNNVFLSTRSYEPGLTGGSRAAPGELEPPETPANARQAMALSARSGEGRQQRRYEVGRRNSDYRERTSAGGSESNPPTPNAIGAWGSIIAQHPPMDEGKAGSSGDASGGSPFPLPSVRDAAPREAGGESPAALTEAAEAAAPPTMAASSSGGGSRRVKKPPQRLVVSDSMQGLEEEDRIPWVTSRPEPTSHLVGGSGSLPSGVAHRSMRVGDQRARPARLLVNESGADGHNGVVDDVDGGEREAGATQAGAVGAGLPPPPPPAATALQSSGAVGMKAQVRLGGAGGGSTL